MLNQEDAPATRCERPTIRTDLSSHGRWENVGGANLHANSAITESRPERTDEGSTSRTSISLDARQHELMTIASSDRRPPSRRQRMLESRSFVVGAIVIGAGIASWILVKSVSMGAVSAGLALGMLLMVGASPVRAAGLLRGCEERTARALARFERQGTRRR